MIRSSRQHAVIRYVKAAEAASGLNHIEDLVLFQFHPVIQILLNIKQILLFTVTGILIVRMLGQIVLVRKERSHTTELQDTLAAIHDSKLISAHQFLSQLLVVHTVARAVASGIRGVEGINGFLP